MMQRKPLLSSSTKIIQQTFVMRSLSYPSTEVTKLDEAKRGPAYAFSFIQNDYHFALIKACITAAGGKVIDGQKFSKKTPSKINNPFTRDYAVVLENQKSILIPKDFTNDMDSTEILQFISSHSNYKLVEIEKTYFEGGNIFSIPVKNLFLNGADPKGDYWKYVKNFQENLASLKKAVESLNIQFVNLELSNMVKLRLNVWTEYYYHLDCFMQYLHDGRLVILNKDILSPASYQQLEKIFGKENLIDLGYKDYLENPVLLNFIFVDNKNGGCYISPSLPDAIIEALHFHTIKIITPKCLDSTNENYFDPAFCEMVANALREDEFKEVDAIKLLTHIPRKTEYQLDNGEKYITKDLMNLALEYKSTKGSTMSEVISKTKPFNFRLQLGGPHCVTLELQDEIKEENTSSNFSLVGGF